MKALVGPLPSHSEDRIPDFIFQPNAHAPPFIDTTAIFKLGPERFEAQICQPDVCHSMRRIIHASCDKSAANQSLVPHQEQVVKYLAFLTKMFQVIIAYR